MRRLWFPLRHVRRVFRLDACEICQQQHLLVLTPSMTCYEDPGSNEPFWACVSCSLDYIDQMTSQWADYYAGRL